MASAASQLIPWFGERPVWMQDAVHRLHLKGALTATDDAEKAKKWEEDAKAEGKEALRTEARELGARKWLSEQKATVTVERNRLMAIKGKFGRFTCEIQMAI